jgi:hypothetical protein
VGELAVGVLHGDLVTEEPRRARAGVGDQGLFLRQLQLEIVTQELGQALPDLLCLGFRSGEPEEVVICVSAVAQTPAGGILGIPGGQAAKPPPQPACLGAVTALACLRERILRFSQ